ncbi:MAG: DUF6263 family protein [Phormidesmis sp. CAN_BIN36]|nr:DUF6263 family protein [Phormidesmis sp. CAN_BIN36]
MKKSFFVGSLLLLTAGLGLKPIAVPTIANQVVAQTKPDAIAPASQPKVELLSAGAQPQQVLRFKPAVNTIETTTTTSNTAMEMSIPGMVTPSLINLPSTLMKIETVVTQVDPNGDIHYKFRCTDADITGDSPIIPAGVLNTARTQVKKMVGLSGSSVMDDRGNTKSTSLSISKGVDAATRQMLEQSFHQSLDQLSAPLPEAAVGVGAQWKTLLPAKIYGMTINQTGTYELASLKDGVAILKVGIKQQEGQKLVMPGMQKGANVTFNTTGQGEIKVRLDRLLPQVATLSMTSAVQMQTANPGASVTTIATKTKVEMRLQSK